MELDKLENELRFLKDTLDAGLINEDEYSKEKQRIEDKIKEMEGEDEPAKKADEIAKEEAKPEQIKEEKIEKPELTEASVEASKEEPIKEESKEKETKEEHEAIESPKHEPEKERKHKWIKYWAIAIIFLIVIIGFSITNSKDDKSKAETKKESAFENTFELKKQPICASNKDCFIAGKEGFCINPNTSEARCEYKEAVKIEMLIINDINCVICNTDRITSVVRQLFPGIQVKIINIGNPEANNLIGDFDINVLPAYLFSIEIESSANFAQFKRALIKKKDKYIMSPAASGSAYFFKRDRIQTRLELFLLSENHINAKVKANLKEFLDVFGNRIAYLEHEVKNGEKDSLKEELGITTFPAFLINNQYKFVGIFSADTLKQYFCELNKLEKCDIALSKEIK